MVIIVIMSKQGAWYLAYFPYGLVFGILPVLVPLYFVGSLGGSLLDLGIMISMATLLGIPASIFFGQLPERFGRTKPFILASFISTGILLFFLTEVKNILLFQIIYILIALADSLHPPSTSVFIAESYQKRSWGVAFAKYNFVVGIATALGLGICSIFIQSIGYQTMLWISGFLLLTSFIIALLLVEEPPIYVERWISRLERPVDEVSTLAYQLDAQKYLSGERHGTLKIRGRPRMAQVGLGFMMFSFAATCAFISFPIYLMTNASISSSMVFTIFLTRSLIGTFTYIIAGKLINENNGDTTIKAATGIRILLVILLPTITIVPSSLSPVIAAMILSLFSISFSLFSLGKSIVIMDYASEGTLGTYDALDGLGNMTGGLLGGIIPAIYGFNTLFLICPVFFACALMLFISGLRR